MRYHMSKVEEKLPDYVDPDYLDESIDDEWKDDPLSAMVDEAMQQYVKDPDNPKWVTTVSKTASGDYIKYLMVGDWFFPIMEEDVKNKIKLSYWGTEEMEWLRDVHNGVFEMLLSRGDLLDYCKMIEKKAIDNQLAIQHKLQRDWGDEKFFTNMEEAQTIAKENTRLNIIEQLPYKLEPSYKLTEEE